MLKVLKPDLMRTLQLSSVLDSKQLQTQDRTKMQIKMHTPNKKAIKLLSQMLHSHTSNINSSKLIKKDNQLASTPKLTTQRTTSNIIKHKEQQQVGRTTTISRLPTTTNNNKHIKTKAGTKRRQAKKIRTNNRHITTITSSTTSSITINKYNRISRLSQLPVRSHKPKKSRSHQPQVTKTFEI